MMAIDRTPEKDGLSQDDSVFWLISTPAGGKYIVSHTDLNDATKNFSNRSWAGLFQVWACRVGEPEFFFTYHLPLNVSDISPYSEPVPDTEPIGRATVEEPSSEKSPFEFEVSGF